MEDRGGGGSWLLPSQLGVLTPATLNPISTAALLDTPSLQVFSM